MFNLLVAQQIEGSFQKAAVFSVRKNGTFPVPARLHGSLVSGVAKDAARFFAAEPAAVQFDREVSGKLFRFTRF